MQSCTQSSSRQKILLFSIDADGCVYHADYPKLSGDPFPALSTIARPNSNIVNCNEGLIDYIVQKALDEHATKVIIASSSARQCYRGDLDNAAIRKTPLAVVDLELIKIEVARRLARFNPACQVEYDPVLNYDIFNTDPKAALTYDFVKAGCPEADEHYYTQAEYYQELDGIWGSGYAGRLQKLYALYRQIQSALIKNRDADLQCHYIDDRDEFLKAVPAMLTDPAIALKLPANATLITGQYVGKDVVTFGEPLQGTEPIDFGFRSKIRSFSTNGHRPQWTYGGPQKGLTEMFSRQEILEGSIIGLVLASADCEKDSVQREVCMVETVKSLKELQILLGLDAPWGKALREKIYNEISLASACLGPVQQERTKAFAFQCFAQGWSAEYKIIKLVILLSQGQGSMREKIAGYTREVNAHIEELKAKGEVGSALQQFYQNICEISADPVLALRPEERWRVRVFVEMKLVEDKISLEHMFYKWETIAVELKNFFKSFKSKFPELLPMLQYISESSKQLFESLDRNEAKSPDGKEAVTPDENSYSFKYALIALFEETHHLLTNLNSDAQVKYQTLLTESHRLVEEIKFKSNYAREWQNLEMKRAQQEQESSFCAVM